MFDAYIEQYGGRLYALCLRLCDGRQSDAQDLYQESWLKAYRAIGSFRQEGNFSAWLSRICVNAYRDALRKQRRYAWVRRDTQQDHQALMDSLPAPQPPEGEREVREALGNLPGDLKVCVVLYYFHGCSVAETAGALGIPQGTVKSRLSRGRRLLREVLERGDG